jgi:hypothetical protein
MLSLFFASKSQILIWTSVSVDIRYKPAFPAPVPEMSYAGTTVANGQDARLALDSLIQGGVGQVERDNIKKALLDYCGQDTLGMVRLVEKIQRASA